MLFDQWRDDLRLAWRGLRRARGFTAAAVLTLAVGIAGTTTMFALIQGVLLRPLPVREQDRVLVAWTELRSTGFTHWPYSVEAIELIRDASQLLERVAGVGHTGAGPMVAVENGAATYISGVSVTGDFFDVLGVAPLLGRTLTRADDVSGAESVLVITHALWQGRYGGSPDAIGRRLLVGERPFTIVGVMPPDVEYPRRVEAWMTVAAHTAILPNAAFRVDVDLIARGLAALLLAAIGLYAVMGAYVRRRYTEIGVRIAVGATTADVHRLVLGEGLRLAGAGAAIGLVSAALGTRLLRGLLFDVHPLDPGALVAAALLLVGASALA